MRVRVGAALLVIVAAAAAFNYLRPIPAVAAVAKLPATDVVPGTAPTLPWPAQGAGAIGVSGLGVVASSGNEKVLPAASVTKVMTAMIALEDKPLQKGEAGPSITLTDVDVQAYESDLNDKQSVVQVSVGEQLTELEALEAMLIPSANNLAETVARWDAGSIPAFVDKMNARAAALHLAQTRFADPAGASSASASTPTDLLKLGMAAMQNAVFAEIVAMGQASLPVAGTVYNVNRLLGTDG